MGFFWIAGVMLSCCGATIFASTFIPSGSCALNPQAIPTTPAPSRHTSRNVDDDNVALTTIGQ